MLKTIYIIVVASSLAAIAGCGSTVGARAEWIQGHGGIVVDCRQGRATAALGRLGTAGSGANVRVLESDAVCAYGWPDGSLFVTRGLVNLLDDRELSAALAHELGHLLDDGHVRAPVSLRGCCTSVDAEERADAIGARLLNQSGVGAGAMASMLRKVAASPGARPGCQEAVVRRIGLLRQQIAAD